MSSGIGTLVDQTADSELGAPRIAIPVAQPAVRRVAAIASAWAVPAIIALDVCALLWLSAHLNMWIDEAYTLHTTSGGLAYALRQSLFWELQPPLYFLVLTLLRSISVSIFLARFFSIACTAAMLWVAAGISRRLFPAQHPAWLVAALAINPFVVDVAVEIRVYAMVMLLSALLFYLFLAGYVDNGSRWQRIAFVAVALIALYTQYYLGFLLPAFAVALVALRRWPALRAYALGMVVVGAAALPILFVIKHQIAANSANFAVKASAAAGILHVSKILGAAVLSVDMFPSVSRWVIALSCLLATVVIVAAWRTREDERSDTLLIPFIVVAVAGALLAVVVTLADQPLTLRYSAGLLLPALLCVYAAFAFTRPRLRTVLLAVWIALIGTTCGLTLATEYQHMAKIGDWMRVAAYVQAHEQPGQPIVIFEPQAALTLAAYYRGPNEIIPLPRAMNFQRYDLRLAALQSTTDVVRVFERAGSVNGYVWLVTTDFCRRDPINFKCELLDAYVARHYDVRSERAFYWSHVRLLQSKQESSPALKSAGTPPRAGRHQY
jgi:hypothetical protein